MENFNEFQELFAAAIEMEDDICHYGMPRRSGRYPWGSGENPYQRSGDFLSRVEQLKKAGMNEKEIVDAMSWTDSEGHTHKLSTTQYRAALSIAKNERRKYLVDTAKSLKSDGLNNVQIAEKLGLAGESTVRSLLNEESESRMRKAEQTANNLKTVVDEYGMVDVGKGTERQLKISPEKLNQALEILKMEGYEVYGNRVPQATNPGRFTTLKVLCAPGTKSSDIYDYGKIHYMNDVTSDDGGDTFRPIFEYPKSMDSSRLAIRYAEDGGEAKDGLMEIRRGVADLSLGGSNYSQVRILVDGTHYLKGMAAYSDNLPDGVDIVFNTNKSKDKAMTEVLKKIKADDPDNPFGSSVKSTYYIDENGNRQLSLINKRSDEGEWTNWSDHLPSQFLSKQPLTLIKKQLNLTASDKEDEYNEILSLTNPTVKKSMLLEFAENCDSDAVELQAAALPGQKYQVILPLTSSKDTEVYAPNFKDGTTVALVRYPHAGTFEIPILKVNNRLEEGKNLLGTNPADAIGINKNVADRLSGADFDGDTVMVIPLSDKVNIKSTPALFSGFDTKHAYGADEPVRVDADGTEHYYRNGKEYPIMHDTQMQMGKISNLITDMTLLGADSSEMERAVKHSMVVIDAEKHHLDYKSSEIDNNIEQLKKDYQGKVTGGASTLISRAKSPQTVNERKEGAFFTKEGNHSVTVLDENKEIYEDNVTGEILRRSQLKPVVYINPETGEKMYHDTNRTYRTTQYTKSDGKKVNATVITKDGVDYYKDESGKYVRVTTEKVSAPTYATNNSSKMAEVSDARQLISVASTPQEQLYADYANKMKALGNKARKEYLSTKDIPYSPSAAIIYKEEATSLSEKLNQSLLNAPKERQAQTIAASIIKAKTQSNPNMTKEEKQKLAQRELQQARNKVGAHRTEVEITAKEWEAIQAGAISKSKLEEIIDNCNTKTLKELAMPRDKTVISNSKISRMKNMANSGYTNAEIADALGISTTTVIKYLQGKE